MPAESFENVAVPEIPRLLRYACALTGDPDLADDVVQTVMVRAYSKWDRVGSADVPQAYLTTMVTNEVLSFRRRKRVPTVPLEQCAVDERHHSTPASGEPEVTELRSLLQVLPVRQRAALVLRYYLDYSDVDAAAVLGCAPGTLRSLCSRGIASLRLDSRRGHPSASLFDQDDDKVRR